MLADLKEFECWVDMLAHQKGIWILGRHACRSERNLNFG